MSLNKFILLFLIVLLIFGGLIFYQYKKGNTINGKVIVQEETFNVQIVEKPPELQKGLSGRGSMPANQGMLFVFPNKGDYPFWMKDMEFPLDIIYINDNKVVTIHEEVPAPLYPNENLQVYRSKVPANKVLELNAGSVRKFNIKVGDEVFVEKAK